MDAFLPQILSLKKKKKHFLERRLHILLNITFQYIWIIGRKYKQLLMSIMGYGYDHWKVTLRFPVLMICKVPTGLLARGDQGDPLRSQNSQAFLFVAPQPHTSVLMKRNTLSPLMVTPLPHPKMFFTNLEKNRTKLSHPPPLRKLPYKVIHSHSWQSEVGTDLSETRLMVFRRLCFISVSARVQPEARKHTS